MIEIRNPKLGKAYLKCIVIIPKKTPSINVS